MNRPRILGMGTASPPHAFGYEDALALALHHCGEDERKKRLVKVLYRKSGVKNRYMILPHKLAVPWGGADDPTGKGPTTRQRMEMYEQHAPLLAIDASAKALDQANCSPDKITHLVTVSCTGFNAPGVDYQLIQQFGLRPTVQRTHVGFMGCHGAINGLRVAEAFIGNDPSATVLLCAVECCGIHYSCEFDPDQMLGNALFADGAAAAVCGSGDEDNETNASLVATGSCMLPNSAETMRWQVGDHGFDMYLSKEVGNQIEQHLRPWLTEWLAQQSSSIDQIDTWAVHPGGPRILSAVQESLGLTDEDIRQSVDVLAKFGNMSSPTVLFLLDRWRQQPSRGSCLALGFGPGLVAEVAYFES